MPNEDMQAELEQLRAENEVLKQSNKRTGAISMKVSEKGRCPSTVSVDSR